MNSEEIKKLTVADLKKELKARNLPVSGNKSELTQRLSEHALTSDERQILEHSGVDESLLEGVHEDEVLGLSAGNLETGDNTLTTSEPERRKISAKGTAVVTKPDATTTIKSEATQKAPGDSIKTQEAQEAAKKIRLKPSVSSDSEAATKPEKVATTVSDPEKLKIERAKKFNLPATEADRKQTRAERFGTSSSQSDSTGKLTSASSIGGSAVGLDAELLAKRAQRFGVPVVKTSKISVLSSAKPEDAGKLKERAERFGIQKETGKTSNGAEKDDVNLLKRQLRFDGGGGGSGDAVEKKKARAERFGLAKK